MTTADPTFEIFLSSVLTDENWSYPDDSTFVSAAQSEWLNSGDILRHLQQGRAVVIVDDDLEVLMRPLPRRWLVRLHDRFRKRATVGMRYRHHDHEWDVVARVDEAHIPAPGSHQPVPTGAR